MPDEDDETKLFLPNDDEAFRALQEGDDLIDALQVPEGIEPVAFASLLRDLYSAAIRRAGLAHADPTAVALVASGEGLLALLEGKLDPANPLAVLARPHGNA